LKYPTRPVLRRDVKLQLTNSHQTRSSFSGQMVVDTSIYCIKVEYEVGYREFVYAVSAIFILPVWPEMAVGYYVA